jgi:hypothetical protein
MGAATECFKEATAIVVPQNVFAPVKKCKNLLLLRSNAAAPFIRLHIASNIQQGISAIITCWTTQQTFDGEVFFEYFSAYLD